MAAVVFIIALGAGLWSQTHMGEVALDDKKAAFDLVQDKVRQIADVYKFNVAESCTQDKLVYEFLDGKHYYTCTPNEEGKGGNKMRKKSKKTKKKKLTKKRKTMKKKY